MDRPTGASDPKATVGTAQPPPMPGTEDTVNHKVPAGQARPEPAMLNGRKRSPPPPPPPRPNGVTAAGLVTAGQRSEDLTGSGTPVQNRNKKHTAGAVAGQPDGDGEDEIEEFSFFSASSFETIATQPDNTEQGIEASRCQQTAKRKRENLEASSESASNRNKAIGLEDYSYDRAGGADLREAIRRSLDTPSVMVEEPLMVERKSARGSRQLTNGRTAAHGPNTNRNATSASQADVSDRSGNALGVSGRSRHFAEAGPVQLAKPQLPHMCACGKSFRNALGLGGHKATCKASVIMNDNSEDGLGPHKRRARGRQREVEFERLPASKPFASVIAERYPEPPSLKARTILKLAHLEQPGWTELALGEADRVGYQAEQESEEETREFAKELEENHDAGPNLVRRKRQRMRKRIAANSPGYNLVSVSLLDRKIKRFEDRRATAFFHPYLVPVNPDDIFNGAEMPLESTRAGSSAFTVVNGPPVIKAEQIPPYTETKSFLHVRLAWQIYYDSQARSDPKYCEQIADRRTRLHRPSDNSTLTKAAPHELADQLSNPSQKGSAEGPDKRRKRPDVEVNRRLSEPAAEIITNPTQSPTPENPAKSLPSGPAVRELGPDTTKVPSSVQGGAMVSVSS